MVMESIIQENEKRQPKFANFGEYHDIFNRFKDSMKKFENLGFTPNYMDEMIGVLKAVEENEKAKKTKKKDTEVIVMMYIKRTVTMIHWPAS